MTIDIFDSFIEYITHQGARIHELEHNRDAKIVYQTVKEDYFAKKDENETAKKLKEENEEFFRERYKSYAQDNIDFGDDLEVLDRLKAEENIFETKVAYLVEQASEQNCPDFLEERDPKVIIEVNQRVLSRMYEDSKVSIRAFQDQIISLQENTHGNNLETPNLMSRLNQMITEKVRKIIIDDLETPFFDQRTSEREIDGASSQLIRTFDKKVHKVALKVLRYMESIKPKKEDASTQTDFDQRARRFGKGTSDALFGNNDGQVSMLLKKIKELKITVTKEQSLFQTLNKKKKKVQNENSGLKAELSVLKGAHSQLQEEFEDIKDALQSQIDYQSKVVELKRKIEFLEEETRRKDKSIKGEREMNRKLSVMYEGKLSKVGSFGMSDMGDEESKQSMTYKNEYMSANVNTYGVAQSMVNINLNLPENKNENVLNGNSYLGKGGNGNRGEMISFKSKPSSPKTNQKNIMRDLKKSKKYEQEILSNSDIEKEKSEAPNKMGKNEKQPKDLKNEKKKVNNKVTIPNHAFHLKVKPQPSLKSQGDKPGKKHNPKNNVFDIGDKNFQKEIQEFSENLLKKGQGVYKVTFVNKKLYLELLDYDEEEENLNSKNKKNQRKSSLTERNNNQDNSDGIDNKRNSSTARPRIMHMPGNRNMEGQLTFLKNGKNSLPRIDEASYDQVPSLTKMSSNSFKKGIQQVRTPLDEFLNNPEVFIESPKFSKNLSKNKMDEINELDSQDNVNMSKTITGDFTTAPHTRNPSKDDIKKGIQDLKIDLKNDNYMYEAGDRKQGQISSSGNTSKMENIEFIDEKEVFLESHKIDYSDKNGNFEQLNKQKNTTKSNTVNMEAELDFKKVKKIEPNFKIDFSQRRKFERKNGKISLQKKRPNVDTNFPSRNPKVTNSLTHFPSSSINKIGNNDEFDLPKIKKYEPRQIFDFISKGHKRASKSTKRARKSLPDTNIKSTEEKEIASVVFVKNEKNEIPVGARSRARIRSDVISMNYSSLHTKREQAKMKLEKEINFKKMISEIIFFSENKQIPPSINILNSETIANKHLIEVLFILFYEQTRTKKPEKLKNLSKNAFEIGLKKFYLSHSQCGLRCPHIYPMFKMMGIFDQATIKHNKVKII